MKGPGPRKGKKEGGRGGGGGEEREVVGTRIKTAVSCRVLKKKMRGCARDP